MYTTERISDNSYPDLLLLYKLSFGLIESVTAITRKYDTNIFGLKNVGILAKDENNEVAAYYGVFPALLEYNSQDIIVAQSGDTMTAPNHQKKGLFTKLAKEANILSEELGIRMIFGFPNENSYPGFKNKLGWIFCGNMQKFTFRIKTIPFCELSSKYSMFEPLYRKYTDRFLNSFRTDLKTIDLNCFNYTNVNGLIKKDMRFFIYKLGNRKCSLVRYKGFDLLIKVDAHLIIGEVGRIKKEEGLALVAAIKQLARKLGCSKAQFSLSENHWLYDILKDIMKPDESLPIGFYWIDRDIIPETIQFSWADYDTF